MELVLTTALYIPLAGFLFILLFSGCLPRKVVEWVGPGTVCTSFLLFSYLLYGYDGNALDTTLFTWIDLEKIHVDFSLHLDHLSLLMALIITGVGFLIHLYSTGYMDHEKDIARYFSVMNFFIFSMLLLVLASDLLILFIGWEGVGLASYLLIGYYYQKKSASLAAKKAFIVNRIGDLGLLLGIFLTLLLFGTTDIKEICRRAGAEFAVGTPIIILLTCLYFWGATAKSAQFPLHTWLPDAMEGPTPVSALIHAATMVTAGVYLVIRLHPVFIVAPETLALIAFIGTATSLYAALSATAQVDLKRVLAYSTISQLGLMFLACGESADFAAMFHLTTHAFVKALLFLAAGNVIHMMHGVTLMDQMGGLSKIFSKTNILFLIGVLSMSGIPPLAIFFSKDLILEEGFRAGCELCFNVGLLIALLTAFYLTRAYILTFKGPSHARNDFQEAPSIMLMPVMILALLSLVGGFLGFAVNKAPILMEFLEPVGADFISEELTFGFHISVETWISSIVAIVGVLLAAFSYTRWKDRLGSTVQFFLESFYINQLYNTLIVKPCRFIVKIITSFFEPALYDTTLKRTADGTLKAARELQEIQSGQIRSYISWIVIGASGLILYLHFGGS